MCIYFENLQLPADTNPDKATHWFGLALDFAQDSTRVKLNFDRNMRCLVDLGLTLAEDATGLVVGAHLYRAPVRGTLESYVTWVSPQYRRTGLATTLWDISLSVTVPHRVKASTISKNGTRMFEKLRVLYPDVSFSIDNL